MRFKQPSPGTVSYTHLDVYKRQDEYYYYVKAVPKINVVAPEMNVKRINAQRKKKKNWK